MAFLTREAILAARDRRTAPVAVPEWGGEVLLAEMTAEARERYEALFQAFTAGKLEKRTIRAELVAACAVVDGTSFAPLFASAADVEGLAAKSARALNRLFVKAIELNVLTTDAADKIAGE